MRNKLLNELWDMNQDLTLSEIWKVYEAAVAAAEKEARRIRKTLSPGHIRAYGHKIPVNP